MNGVSLEHRNPKEIPSLLVGLTSGVQSDCLLLLFPDWIFFSFSPLLLNFSFPLFLIMPFQTKVGLVLYLFFLPSRCHKPHKKTKTRQSIPPHHWALFLFFIQITISFHNVIAHFLGTHLETSYNINTYYHICKNYLWKQKNPQCKHKTVFLPVVRWPLRQVPPPLQLIWSRRCLFFQRPSQMSSISLLFIPSFVFSVGMSIHAILPLEMDKLLASTNVVIISCHLAETLFSDTTS